MFDNTVGAQNSAYGLYAMHGNAKGDYNAALGGYALYSNTSGSSNIAVGYKAGFYPTAGANNIHIGNFGAAGDTGVIKIGIEGTQKLAYVAGISGVTVSGTGTPVVINTNGQLGVAGSSERFKTEIMPMGGSTERLEELQPVTFRYKSEPRGARQYGLIAEEVAKVYPELVVRNPKGEIISVRYDELAPMLLNEVKQEKQQLAAQAAEMHELRVMILAIQTTQRSD
jgi:hypothetical protein